MTIKKSILSVDFESWLHTSHYRHVVNDSNSIYHLDKATAQILEVLDRNHTKATFFVLGKVARDNPKLISQIALKGHEIASHGYSHTPLWELNPIQFKKELNLTNTILEDIVQKSVLGFRAPYFSIDNSTAWAINELVEAGFTYDSSIFPMKTPKYGLPEAPQNPYYIRSDNITQKHLTGDILELPISVFRYGKIKLPCSGGIYARMMPYFLLQLALNHISQDGYLNFYFHPWEIFSKKDKAPNPGVIKYFLANFRAETYLDRIEKIIRQYPYTSAENFIKLNQPISI